MNNGNSNNEDLLNYYLLAKNDNYHHHHFNIFLWTQQKLWIEMQLTQQLKKHCMCNPNNLSMKILMNVMLMIMKEVAIKIKSIKKQTLIFNACCYTRI